jgi:hypothetical protein
LPKGGCMSVVLQPLCVYVRNDLDVLSRNRVEEK